MESRRPLLEVVPLIGELRIKEVGDFLIEGAGRRIDVEGGDVVPHPDDQASLRRCCETRRGLRGAGRGLPATFPSEQRRREPQSDKSRPSSHSRTCSTLRLAWNPPDVNRLNS